VGCSRITAQKAAKIVGHGIGIGLRSADHQQGRVARQREASYGDGLGWARNTEYGAIAAHNALYRFSACNPLC
jgi:hypothetical protein